MAAPQATRSTRHAALDPHPSGGYPRQACTSPPTSADPSQEDVGDAVRALTPHLDFAAPPGDSGPSWGPLGPPDEIVEVPPAMQLRSRAEPQVAGNRQVCLAARLPDDGKGLLTPILWILACVRKASRIFWKLGLAS
jgi:hypothetical protein